MPMAETAILREFPLFKGLNEAKLSIIADRIIEKSYNDGKMICSRGDKGQNLFLIKAGSVYVTLPLYRYDKKVQTVSLLTEGMFFGELSFFDGKKYSADVTAKGTTDLLVLNRADFDQIIEADPESGYEIQQHIILSLIGIIRKMNTRYSRNVFFDR
jgi:CRP-like cAMP-binding protein